MSRRLISAVLLTLTTSVSGTALSAQSAADAISAGNKATDARNAPTALQEYEKALALEPNNYEALWRAASAGIDVGEFDPSEAHRTELFKTAQQRAQLAVQAKPDDTEGHYILARALGRTALTLGSKERIKYAKEVRDHALTCLKFTPKHSGCLHIMGVWNAEVMRLSGFTRMIAKTFLGGKIFNEASWSEAQHYMVLAVTNDPRRIVHRLDLGKVYADEGRKADARTQLQLVVNGPLIDYNDPHYKEQATAALKDL